MQAANQMEGNIEDPNAIPYDGDVIVLGVGSCGEDLSLQLLDAGLKVVGIGEGLIGGECAYWACIPSKMMITAANTLHDSLRLNKMAGASKVIPDWKPVAKRIIKETSNWDDAIAIERYTKRGGHLVKGRGRLIGPRTVSVGDKIFKAKHGVVIATGSKPFIPSIPGLSEVDYWTTYDVIQLKTLPQSVIVLGGGAVGCELGQMLSRFGVDITIIERSERLLHAEEPEASREIKKTFLSEGIKAYTNSNIHQVRKLNGKIVVELEGGEEITGERLLVALGRRPDLRDLGLETVGIDSNAKFIKVDERLRAGDGVWAMGDVTGIGMFTHVALYHSSIIASDLLGLEHSAAKYDAVPRVTFTDPEVAAVGMSEQEAIQAGIDVVVTCKQLSGTVRGWIHVVEGGIIKLIISKNEDLLIGATVVGPHAGELLGMLTLAIHSRTPLEQLRNMIYAYPTFYGGIGEALGAYGRGITTVIDPPYKGLVELDLVAERG